MIGVLGAAVVVEMALASALAAAETPDEWWLVNYGVLGVVSFALYKFWQRSNDAKDAEIVRLRTELAEVRKTSEEATATALSSMTTAVKELTRAADAAMVTPRGER